MLFSKQDLEEYVLKFNALKYINNNFNSEEKFIIEGLDLLIVREGDKTFVLKCDPKLSFNGEIKQNDIKKVGKLIDLDKDDKYCMLLDGENMKRYIELKHKQFVEYYRNAPLSIFCEEVLDMKLLPYQKRLIDCLKRT